MVGAPPFEGLFMECTEKMLHLELVQKKEDKRSGVGGCCKKEKLIGIKLLFFVT